MPEPVFVPSTDGVTLAVYESHPDTGSDAAGPGRDVLLAHANGFCAGVFAALAGALGEHRCVSYDARAHGHSTRGSADMSWEGHRDDVLSVHDALGLTRPVGVGHSMGGAALLLAEQLRPGTFAALWLFEPIVFPSEFADVEDNPMAQGALRRRSRFESREEAFANFAGKPPLSELSAGCLSAYVTYGFHPADSSEHTADSEAGTGFVLACAPEDEAAGYRMGGRHSAWDRLGEVNCPVVVLRGNDTEPSPATMAPVIAELLPEGRLETHEELGHFGPLEEPYSMARSVLEFMGTLPR
jgi:pimeloyl-ACP methyl ester carboxylesterase